MRPRPSRSPTCTAAAGRSSKLFRTLKTQGFDIEAVRIGEDAPRTKLTMAALVAAVTIQQLVHARDGGAGQSRLRPVTDAFDPDDLPLLEALCKSLEGRTERQRNPHPRGSLAYAAWVCAGLGGWTGYYGKPRTHRHAPGLARVPSRQTRRRPHRPATQCVNLLALAGRANSA